MTKRERILVVDDEREVREVLRDFLETKGYVVSVASTGEEALTAVQQHQPCLILLDLMMPGMNGLETIQRIREIDRAVGIIMVTAVADPKIAKEAIAQEAYDYITKPIDLGYLELAILTKLAQMDRSRPGDPGAGTAEVGRSGAGE